MEAMSEIIGGQVRRFKMVHFGFKINDILSEKFKTNVEGKMLRFVQEFTTCLVYQLCHETELYIGAGAVLPCCRVASRLLVVLHYQL